MTLPPSLKIQKLATSCQSKLNLWLAYRADIASGVAVLFRAHHSKNCIAHSQNESVSELLSWENVKAALNSAFMTSLVGALAGAFAGARAAQRISERSKERDSLLAQMNAINAATTLCFSTFNVAAAFKTQLALPMFEKYNQAKADFDADQQARATGQRQGNAEVVFDSDLKMFSAPSVPIKTLNELVFNKLAAPGRPIALAAILEQSLNSIQDSVSKRNALARHFMGGGVAQELLFRHYFGIRLPNGHTNHEFPDLVAAIYRYTDDVVFFSALLCKDLIQHGTQTRTEFRKKYGEAGPKMSSVDFSTLKKDGVIPSETEYAGWLSGFPTDMVQAERSQTGDG